LCTGQATGRKEHENNTLHPLRPTHNQKINIRKEKLTYTPYPTYKPIIHALITNSYFRS
jgi:hypothetical protein